MVDPVATQTDMLVWERQRPRNARCGSDKLRGFLNKGKAAFSSFKDTAQFALVGSRRGGSDRPVQRAAGGRLELLGGDFGTGFVSIGRSGQNRRLGFLSPEGKHVTLEYEVEAVTARPDCQDRRLLSAAGWAVTVGSVMGPAGAAVGAGIRLLHPGQMMLTLRLRDGRTMVARTDRVTVNGLHDLSKMLETDASTEPSP